MNSTREPVFETSGMDEVSAVDYKPYYVALSKALSKGHKSIKEEITEFMKNAGRQVRERSNADSVSSSFAPFDVWDMDIEELHMFIISITVSRRDTDFRIAYNCKVHCIPGNSAKKDPDLDDSGPWMSPNNEVVSDCGSSLSTSASRTRRGSKVEETPPIKSVMPINAFALPVEDGPPIQPLVPRGKVVSPPARLPSVSKLEETPTASVIPSGSVVISEAEYQREAEKLASKLSGGYDGVRSKVLQFLHSAPGQVKLGQLEVLSHFAPFHLHNAETVTIEMAVAKRGNLYQVNYSSRCASEIDETERQILEEFPWDRQAQFNTDHEYPCCSVQ